MRHLLAATALAAFAATSTSAAPPKLTPAEREATHAMFEHVIDIPTVIGRHNVPQMAQYVADQFKAAGFPAADIHVIPYHTGRDRKSTRLNSSHPSISYAVFCLKKK